MSNLFHERPILNSPYECPQQHWELDKQGQPTQVIQPTRRPAEFLSPIPRPKKRQKADKQQEIVFNEGQGLSTTDQQYDLTETIRAVRSQVDRWRVLASPREWQVTPETARLLQHWRHHDFADLRPFFCQVEAIETAIWLVEVAPRSKEGRRILDRLDAANRDANPGIHRIALKLATGAGKTTVMAMLIAWQTVNAVRRPGGKTFTRGFLVVAPGLTIRERLQVLLPQDLHSYYANRELVPSDMLDDIRRAKIVITNYHAFKLRERLEIAGGTRGLLQGRGEPLQTLESEGQMIQRVMNDLMGMKNIMVLNDEAHHCYREKIEDSTEADLTGDEKEEVKINKEAARMWISGLEAVDRVLGVARVIDLSATPFFLRGSGYAEGTLFPWTVSDFSLMDAIECGIVKLPRVPVAENIAGNELPVFRDLWKHIGPEMPKKGRGKGGSLDPLRLPTRLQTALQALYGHYETTFHLWRERGIQVPPCFIVVCQNTAISKLVFDYVAGFERRREDGTTTTVAGSLALFRNYDEDGKPLPRPNTLLIDSEQLESGEALDDSFRLAAGPEIEVLRREIIERTGDARAGNSISDQDLLRGVMNSVGKRGTLGESIRCVVSVSMLTEGWDANTVTHILGLRAFGTQLLCEQVIGRALRRQSYDLNEEGLFNVEYADIFGIPFDFAAKPVIAPPQPPRETIQVRAVRPERDALEIIFPRVLGYRVDLPTERLDAAFTPDSVLELTPDLVGPSVTQNSGIIGEAVDLGVGHLGHVRVKTLAFELTKHLLETRFRDSDEDPKLHLFGQLKRITLRWFDEGYLVCKGENISPGLLKYRVLAEMAADRINAAITRHFLGDRPILAQLDAYNPTGSTRNVRFNTSMRVWTTRADRCQINHAPCDSEWEIEFCRAAEAHPRVLAYCKNHNLGFEVPYAYAGETRRYRPDFILRVDDGHGPDDPLHLIVEIKGYRGEDAKMKKETMEVYWVPGVNRLGTHGRWAFAEMVDIHLIATDLRARIEAELALVVTNISGSTSS